MGDKIKKVLILDYKYSQKKNFTKQKLIFLNKRAFFLNKGSFIFKRFQVLKDTSLNRDQRKKNYSYLDRIYEEILTILSKRLTKINKVDFNKNQWNILIGSWLFYYLSTCFNRYSKLNKIFKVHKNITVYIEKLENRIETFSTEDFLEKIHLNNLWNAEVYYGLLIEMKQKVLLNNVKEKKYQKKLIIGHKTSLKRKIISLILNFIFIKFSKNNSFIITSYLPLFQEIYLNLKTNGVPILFVTQRTELKNYNYNKSNNSKNLSIKKKKDTFFNFINKNIIQDIPEVFIKYFSKIYKESLNTTWPKNPNSIFTSNLYESDELFKMYVAIKNKECKSSYIIGQHGNSYNVTIQSEYNPETKFSDKFLSWSSKKNKKNFLPLGNFTNEINKKRKKIFKLKNILIVMRSKGLDYEVFDRPSMNRKYEYYLLLFLKNLSPKVRNKIIIKFHFTHLHDDIKSKIKKLYKDIKILDIKSSIEKYYADYSTLVIFNYDSSGFYKTLHNNKPTLCFWPNEFSHVRDSGLNYYKKMKKVGIYHDNPKKLSLRLESLINNDQIFNWWYSRPNQDFINDFNSRYNKKLVYFDKIVKLKNLLLNRL